MTIKKTLIIALSATAGLAFAGRVGGLEQDRGTLKMPDYVATPHSEEKAAGEAIAPQIPNKSLADDQNQDGIVSREEWAGTTENFIRLDANEDGLLSQRELESYIQIGFEPELR